MFFETWPFVTITVKTVINTERGKIRLDFTQAIFKLISPLCVGFKLENRPNMELVSIGDPLAQTIKQFYVAIDSECAV